MHVLVVLLVAELVHVRMGVRFAVVCVGVLVLYVVMNVGSVWMCVREIAMAVLVTVRRSVFVQLGHLSLP